MANSAQLALASILAAAAAAPALALDNPSFEDDGESFFFSLSRLPVGWGGEPGGGGTRGQVTTIGNTDGTYAADLYIAASGAAPGSLPVRLTQSVDLTGIDTLTFDAELFPEIGWNGLVVADFRVGGVVEWSQTSGGFYHDQAVDVSALSGVYEIEFRLSTTDSGPGTAGHNFLIDNVRDVPPPPRLTSTRLDPLLIRAGLDTFTMTVTTSDPAVSEIHIDLGTALTQGGVAAGTVTFRDDGTSGDVTAGDGVFTAEDLGVASTPGMIGISVPGTRTVDYLYPSEPTIQASEDLALSFRYLDASVPVPAVADYAADVRGSSYAVSMERPLLGIFPWQTVDGAALAQRYYTFFSDDLDFLLLSHDYSTSIASGSFSLVRNDVVGTGQPIVDNSALYGSAGVLRGLVNVYFGNVASFSLLNHQVLHYWAAHLDPVLELNTNHWQAITNTSTGFGNSGPNLVYDRLELVSGDTYRGIDYPDATPGAYNDLELYLMGLEPDIAVTSPIDTLVNPVFQGIGTDVCDPVCGTSYLFTADSLDSVTMADITTAEGVRQPAYPSSPTSFRGRLVVVYDRVLSDVELAFYDYAMREYEKAASSQGLTFAAATGDRATLSLPEPTADLGLLAGCAALFVLARRRLRRPQLSQES